MRGFLEAALRPHPRRQQLLRGEVWHCPLCGFLLPNDWDGHFLPCIVRHAREIRIEQGGNSLTARNPASIASRIG